MIHIKNWVEAKHDFWPNGENKIGVECGSRGYIYESNLDGALLVAFPEAIVNFTDMQHVRPLQEDASTGTYFEDDDESLDRLFAFETSPEKDDVYFVELDLVIKDELDLPPSALALSDEDQWKVFDAYTNMMYMHTATGRNNTHSVVNMIPWITKVAWSHEKPDSLYVYVNLEMSASNQFQYHIDRLGNLYNEAARGSDKVGMEVTDNQLKSLYDTIDNIVLTLNWVKARMEATNFEVIKALEDEKTWKRLIKEVL